MELKGYELFEQVFGEDMEVYEIEDHDGVTCYKENLSYHDEWYIFTDITFRYMGKKYLLQRKDHSSDNVSDTTYLFDTFKEVIEDDEMSSEINEIIKRLEDGRYNTLTDVVMALERLKKLAQRMNR